MDEQALLERSDGPVTRSRLIHDLTALGLTDQERIAGFVYIGHSAKPPEDRERPSLDKIVTYFQGAGR